MALAGVGLIHVEAATALLPDCGQCHSFNWATGLAIGFAGNAGDRGVELCTVGRIHSGK